MKRRFVIGWMVAAVAAGTSMAATPPALLNYQGVLRSATDQPLTGSYDVVFRLYDAQSGGNEILLDRHLAVNVQAVQVSNGLFATQVGGGEVLDGSGPGTYTSVAAAFRDYTTLWLGVQVGAETLTPRTRIAAAGYALNATNLDGKAASSFLDTTATSQTKSGHLTVAGPAGGTGIDGWGGIAGGSFTDSDSGATAYVGYGTYGISAVGPTVGGFFQDSAASAHAYVGNAGNGILAVGQSNGGEFHDQDGTGYGYVGHSDYGVWGSGSYAGGFFTDGDSSGNVYLGFGDWGVSAYGSVGAGLFDDSNSSGLALVGYGDTGVDASGAFAGGYFKDTDEPSYGYVGAGEFGVWGFGDGAGGTFADAEDSGYAYVGADDQGILGYGNLAGGFFQDRDNSGYAYVGYGDRGIWGKGTFAGGTFSHPNNITFWADVATPTKKITGTGTVSFVQNHPDRKDKVVVYAAPEGDEVAVYTRGTARLTGGEARVRLGETFALVANPDIGLTATVTARGEGAALYVASVSTTDLVVKAGDAGAPDAAFDYMVWGLRIGFERHPVVQRKEREAFLADTEAFDALGAADPELGSTASLTRFAAMRDALGEKAPLDLRRADALVARINEGKDAALVAAAEAANADAAPLHAARPAAGPADRSSSAAAVPPSPPASFAHATGSPQGPLAPSVPAIVPQLTLAPVAGAVSAGDVLVLDASIPGSLRTADREADRGVAGCAIAAPEGVDVPAGQSAIGTTGIVLCRVDATSGAIAVGDLLTTSVTPGHAMRAVSAEGAILGKAMEPLESGTATIRVLVTLR
jgi:hypothetical protein